MRVDSHENIWTASTDFTIKHWDGRSYFLKIALLGHTNWVRCIELAPHVKQLWSGGDDGTIRVWDTESGAVLDEKAFSDGPLSMLLVDNHLWIGSRNNVIRVYDLKSITCVKMLTGHKGWVTCLEKVGGEIWSGSADRTLRVWDASDLACIQKIDGFRGWMYSVASLGAVLWASCSDQKIRVYGITEQKKLTVQIDLPDDIRPRASSSARPRGLSLKKRKCVDVGTQTTLQFPPLERRLSQESNSSQASSIAPVKRQGSSTDYFEDHLKLVFFPFFFFFFFFLSSLREPV